VACTKLVLTSLLTNRQNLSNINADYMSIKHDGGLDGIELGRTAPKRTIGRSGELGLGWVPATDPLYWGLKCQLLNPRNFLRNF
jgi:hypothetical protein